MTPTENSTDGYRNKSTVDDTVAQTACHLVQWLGSVRAYLAAFSRSDGQGGANDMRFQGRKSLTGTTS